MRMVSHASICRFGFILNLTHITLTSLDTLCKQGFNYPTLSVPRGGKTFRVLPRVKSFLNLNYAGFSVPDSPSSWERVRKGLRKKKKERKSEKTLWIFLLRLPVKWTPLFVKASLRLHVPHSSAYVAIVQFKFVGVLHLNNKGAQSSH